MASGCCINASGPAHTAIHVVVVTTTTTKSTTTTTMGKNYASAARSVFAAGKAMRREAKPISMTLPNQLENFVYAFPLHAAAAAAADYATRIALD